MSQTVRGITAEQWSSVRWHLKTDLKFMAGGSYLKDDTDDEFDTNRAKKTINFIRKMDLAFGFREDEEFKAWVLYHKLGNY